jgi:hypothetical protein
MSGGFFNYEQYRIHDIIIRLEQALENEWYIKNHSKENFDYIRKDIDLLNEAYVITQQLDLLLSGDNSEKHFFKGLKEDMKNLEYKG